MNAIRSRRPLRLRLVVPLLACTVLAAASASAQAVGAENVLALRTLLVSHSFVALDAALRKRGAESHDDVDGEALYLNAFDAFESGDSLLVTHLNAWVTEDPTAALARVARGLYFVRMAWAARDHGPEDKPEDEAYREMNRWLALAGYDARAARRLDSAGVMPHALTLEMALLSGEEDDGNEAMEEIVKLCPGTVLLRMRHLEMLSPRFYGSKAKVRAFALRAQRVRPHYPRVAVLLGMPDYDRGKALSDKEKFPQAIEAYSRALAHGDYWGFREGRGLAYLGANRLHEALMDLSAAIDARPGHAPFYSWRSVAYAHLSNRSTAPARAKYMARAMADLRVAAALDRTDSKLLSITHGQLAGLLP